jgi:hypothetical protein
MTHKKFKSHSFPAPFSCPGHPRRHSRHDGGRRGRPPTVPVKLMFVPPSSSQVFCASALLRETFAAKDFANFLMKTAAHSATLESNLRPAQSPYRSLTSQPADLHRTGKVCGEALSVCDPCGARRNSLTSVPLAFCSLLTPSKAAWKRTKLKGLLSPRTSAAPREIPTRDSRLRDKTRTFCHQKSSCPR